jgi:hypothetical protein
VTGRAEGAGPTDGRGMKRRSLAAGAVSCLLASVLYFAPADAREAKWELINADPKGNLLYIDVGGLSRPSEGVVRVRMKFLMGGEGPPMLFLDEVDCSSGMVKRLEVEIHRPAGPEGGASPYRYEFEGKWDRASEGIEKRLVEAVCRR